MEILFAIIFFIIGSICAATKGDTSGLEIIISILMVFGFFYLIYKVGMLGAILIVAAIVGVLIFLIMLSDGNNKNDEISK